MENEPFVKLCVIVLVVYSTSLHELSHAFSANYFGDPTPGRRGRLTWNPIPHLSPIWTAVILPVLLFMTDRGLFCLATTPVTPSRFRRPMRDFALVSLCGPLTNFLCAALMIGILWIPGVWTDPENYNMLILKQAAMWNVIMGMFNLLPIPPLDGYTVIRGLLPLWLRQQGDALARSGTLGLFVAILLGGAIFHSISDPLVSVYQSLLPGGG